MILPPAFRRNGEGIVFTGVCLSGCGVLHRSPAHNILPLVTWSSLGGGVYPISIPYFHWSQVLSRGVPHLDPIILPLVSCPFLGGYPIQSWTDGYPVKEWMGYLHPVNCFIWYGGTSLLGLDRRIPPPPNQDWIGYFSSRQNWMEVPYPPSGLDGVDIPTPPSGTGWHLVRLCRGWYASCGFPQEDFLVYVLSTVHLLCEFFRYFLDGNSNLSVLVSTRIHCAVRSLPQ